MAKVIMDEAHMFFSPVANSDRLREVLRATEGIPAVQYLVKDGQVFVFERLISLMEQVNSTEPEMALQLLPQAFVSPSEAVKDWSVVPYPFEVLNEGGSWQIRHVPFDAMIAKNFETQDHLHEALGTLLLGEAVELHDADLMSNPFFRYQGQVYRSLIHTDEIPADLLPHCAENNDAALTLLNPAYVAGHPLLSEVVFAGIGDVVKRWKMKVNTIKLSAERHVSCITSFPLETLNDDNVGTGIPDERDLAYIEALRSTYPELQVINDTVLCSLHDDFQNACYQMINTNPYRDDDFLFYISGATLGRDDEGDEIRDIGKIAVFLLTEGKSADEIQGMVGSYLARNSSIIALEWWRWRVSKYLAEEQEREQGSGLAVHVFADMFRFARKFNHKTVQVTQTGSQFKE